MSQNTLLRLDRIQLQNFRCFSDCKVDFDPNLTIFVADNAQGKTALLNGISIALDAFVSSIGLNQQCKGFAQSDIHRLLITKNEMVPAPFVKFQAEGMVEGKPIKWSRSLKSDTPLARSSTQDLKSIREAAEGIAGAEIESKPNCPVTLPSVAFYGTGRLWDEHRLTEGKKGARIVSQDRYSAYIDCLSPSSSFKTFSSWYEEFAIILRDPAFRALKPGLKPETLLSAVRKAVAIVLEPTGWTSLDWEFPKKNGDELPKGKGYLVVEHKDRGRFPLSWLSDGVRNMVALVGDLAHRCVRLNPHFGEDAAKLTPGILLIDEIDMHLHPKWQQIIVALLQDAFPLMQLISSTHSPQILTTVKRKCIRMLGQHEGGLWSVSLPGEETKGTESSTALIDVMGVNPIPPVEEARWLTDYTALIENGNHESEAGKLLRTNLEDHYGKQHAVLLDCDRLIRFQSFKLRKSQATEY